MSSFFRRTGVKIAASILCILSLAASLICGLLVFLLLSAGVYDSGGDLYELLIQRLMSNNAHSIMLDYFDPNDPSHPWSSYYGGAFYTGEKSNLLYTITDQETDKRVLATYTGQEEVFYSSDYHFSFDTTIEITPEDPYTVTNQVFLCGDQLYGYDDQLNETFLPLESMAAQYITSYQQLDDDALTEGFSYNGQHYEFDGYQFSPAEQSTETAYASKDYVITCYLRSGLPYPDMYRNIYYFSTEIQAARYWLIALAVAALLLGVTLLILPGCTAGRINGQNAPILSPLYRIPPDVTLFLGVLAAAVCLELTVNIYETTYLTAMLAFDGVMLLALVAIVFYLIMTLCVRVKTHTLISGSLIYWCVRNIGRFFRWVLRGAGTALGYLPLLWRVLACYGALCVAEFLAIMMFVNWYSSGFLFLWFLEKLVLGALVGYVTLAFRRLKHGAESIAAGDYSAKVDETHLLLDFKTAADTLNHIQDGMNAAVDSRMKSERLKTELITNVSHDLKTPLTSIVSYVDLLKQEPAGSEAAAEYLEVLDRQSQRLKKLIEDLVEASKASTGNITVQKTPLDFNMLLGQALGEYSQRLTAASLTPVLHVPEDPVMVQADGRLLWRVFDNLLGNIVKYAMPGTRVYLTVEAGDTVTATFRNISRDPLDVSADELMERFVRGDASRHTEGSGLGLSIARSLTDSMGGAFALNVDGDLFKAMVTFPVLSQLPQPETSGDAEPQSGEFL